MAGRDALLQQINFGIKLRPTKTADKSQPVIQAEGEKFKQYVVPSAVPEQQQSLYSALPNMVPPPPPPPPALSLSSVTQKVITNGQHNVGLSQKPNGQSTNKTGQQKGSIDRDALLDEIRSGVKLKKVVINDKSIVRLDNMQPVRQDINGNVTSVQKNENGFIPNNPVKFVESNVVQPTNMRLKIVNDSNDSRQALMDQINQGVSLKPVQTVDKPCFKVNESTVSQRLHKSQQPSVDADDRPSLFHKSSNDHGLSQNVNKPEFAKSKDNVRNAKEDLSKCNMILELQKDLNKRNVIQSDSNQPIKVSSLPIVSQKSSLPQCSPKDETPLVKLDILKTNLQDLPDKEGSYSNMKSVPCIVAKNEDVLPSENIVQSPEKEMYNCKPITVAATDVDSRVENQCQQNQAFLQRQVSQETKQKEQLQHKDSYEIADNLKSPAEEFAIFLKQKLDQHPQPNYPLKKPACRDQDLKQLLSLTLSCTTAPSSSSKEIQPPTVAPPPIPSTEMLPNSPIHSDSDWLNNGNIVKTITKALERKASVGQLQSPSYSNGHQESSLATGEPLDETVKSSYTQKGSQLSYSNGSHNLHSNGKIDVKERVRKLSVGNLTNFLQNHSSTNGTTISQPHEHVIEVKRIPLHSSEFAKDSNFRQSEFASGNNNARMQNVSGSKTLPRRMHNISSGSFSEQVNGAAIHQNPFNQATLRTLPLDLNQTRYSRHNSDPNLLDSEDSGIDTEFSLFRKVFPNVSQLRNRFEIDNKSDDGSSNKSSPSNPYPSQTFTCKPAMAIPIPPTTEPPLLSVITKFDDKPSRIGSQSRETMRRMSSASESSSYSSSDLSSPRSGGGKREFYVASSNGLIKNSNQGDNNYANSKPNGHHYSGQSQQSHAAIYTARPVFMNGPIKQQDSGDQNRRGSSTVTPPTHPVSTWKVRKDSIPQTVHQYSIAKTLEDMHHRRLDSENSSESGNGDRRQRVTGMTFDDRLDSEVARLVGLTLEDMKQMRFQIDLQDPQGVLLQLQKRMHHPH